MSLTDVDKLFIAIENLRNNTELTFRGLIVNENTFNTIEWNTGVNDNDEAIITTTCPHSELTWTKVKEEMDKL
tara:strand:- start:473 stop:691 length:219 start_codon:yes stop_codon:yes gene_type:complete